MEGSTESLERDIDIETDILDFENAPDYIEGDYRQLLRDLSSHPFAPGMNDDWPWYNRPPVNWGIIVELNRLLSKNGVYSWWYDRFLRAREEFMYVPEDQPNSTYKSGPKKGQRKVKSSKMLKEDYERLYAPGERAGRNPKNNNEMINRCVKKIVEDEINGGRVRIVPNLDEIRYFLETNREEINKVLKKIPKGYRGIVSWMDLRMNHDHMWYESLKFAHPLYTVLSLSDPVLSPRGLYPWFRRAIGSYIPDSRGNHYKDGRADSYIAMDSNLKDNLGENSLAICKVLLEHIDLDVLNNHCSISAVTDIIRYSVKKYPSVPIPTPNGPHNHTQNVVEEDRLNRTSDVAHKMFEMLGIVGLKNQNLRNMQFDVLGESWRPIRTGREGLGMDPRYMDPNDRRLPNPYAKTLLDLCHPNMIALSFNQGLGEMTFDRKKLLNYAVGLKDTMSPLSYLDRDVSDYIGIELSRQPIKYHRKDPLRRNFFSQGEREDRIRAFQRLSTARGLDSLTSHIGPRSGVDMGSVMDIMARHQGVNLLEDAKYPESKMSMEHYTTPERPNIEVGDGIMWSDREGEKYGTVLNIQSRYYKVKNNVTGKIFFIPLNLRGLKVFKDEDLSPTYNPGSPRLDMSGLSLDGGSKRIKTKKKKRGKKSSFRKRRSIKRR